MILFKLPNQDDIYTLKPDSKDSFSVTFFDFNLKKNIRFSGNKIHASEADFCSIEHKFKQRNFQLISNNKTDNLSSYQEKISTIKDFLQREKISKLVLSRRKNLFFDKQISLVSSFKKMCNSYPQAFVYAFVSDDETWLGGFYEILAKYNRATKIFETMSLAGTLQLNEEWTEKEIKEQEAVTQYIEEIVTKYDNKYTRSNTQEITSGNIKHLCTKFSARIDEKDINPLIEALHPTPAVCGNPKDICKEKIKELEYEDRSFYSGYIALESDEEVTCFVNLRCAKIYNNGAKIFVGGGINKQSHPEKEWLETELKAQSIANNLSFTR